MPYDVNMKLTDPSLALPDYDRALGEVLRRVSRLGHEVVPVGEASGRVLREDITADRDQPPFNRSAMDGYAVRSCEVRPGAWLEVVTTIAAGAAADRSVDLKKGAARIATGASVPDAYDAVIRLEQAEEVDGRVRFTLDSVEPGASIHKRGADAQANRLVVRSGSVLGPQLVGVAAGLGQAEVRVTRRPSVSLITTGDEVRPPATPTKDLSPQQIRNSNGPMIDALLRGLGVEMMDHIHVVDDPQATLAAAREALGKSDLVVTVGGISAGQRDFLPGVWRELGLETVVQGVAMQPGKPVLVAQEEASKRLVIGLPGNPVSVLTTAHLFVWPVIRGMLGLSPALPWRRVWLSEPVKANARREAFRSARLLGETRDQAQVIGWHGSGDLVHTCAADGLVRLPQRAEPLDAGEALPFLPLIGGLL